MAINPISAGINANYGVNAVSSSYTAAPSKVQESAPQPAGDQITLGEESAPKKKGFIAWLKDLVKTEVEGPSECYDDRVNRRLEAALSNAQPSDIPDSMPQHDKPLGEPTEFYMPDGSSHTGLSVSVSDQHVPTKESVAGYKYISCSEAEKVYNSNGFGDKLSPTQKAVIKEYCGEGFMAMNGYLLDGEDNATGSLGKAVRCAAGALDKCDVPSGIILNRCASTSELLNYVDPKDYPKFKKCMDKGKGEKLAKMLDLSLTGTQSTRKTFISTSVGKDSDFMENPRVFTKFYVGEGVKGAYVTADHELAQFKGENEYLLAPNTKCTVMGVEYNPKAEGLVMHVFLGDMPEA